MEENLELIQEHVSLKDYNSWKVGGVAEFFCLPETLDQLKEACRWAEEGKQQITLLGGGTNVLISDAGISGLVICLQNFSDVESNEKSGRLEITALAGTRKSEVLKEFLKRRLAPALFLTGLPGDVGGGVVMNAGVSENRIPREFCEIVDWVEVLRPDSLQVDRLDKSDITWSYRNSKGWQPGIVVRAQMSWPMKSEPDIVQQIKLATRKRLSTQPLNQASCGSTFVNPEGGKAGQLIESCGLKGYKIGGAQVSEKHANFLVNADNATAQDIHRLIQQVQKTVKEKTGFELTTEIKYLGW